MQLRYDEDFIEAAAFLCASRPALKVPALQIARFHREREKLYSILEPDARNAAFFQLHLEWFREWGLEKLVTELVAEFPLLSNSLSALVLRKSRAMHDEGAELYVAENGDRNAILALRPELFERPAVLRNYCRHELMHICDMVDPAFGYLPELLVPGLNPAQRRLARERYRLLWDITIDGRLTLAGHVPIATREQHALSFDRTFSFWRQEKRAETVASLWQNRAPRHSTLLELIADPRGLRDAHQPGPGAPCPLCEFPTFSWAQVDRLPPETITRVAQDFPIWTPIDGMCERCLEAYEALATFEQQRKLTMQPI